MARSRSYFARLTAPNPPQRRPPVSPPFPGCRNAPPRARRPPARRVRRRRQGVLPPRAAVLADGRRRRGADRRARPGAAAAAGVAGRLPARARGAGAVAGRPAAVRRRRAGAEAGLRAGRRGREQDLLRGQLHARVLPRVGRQQPDPSPTRVHRLPTHHGPRRRGRQVRREAQPLHLRRRHRPRLSEPALVPRLALHPHRPAQERLREPRRSPLARRQHRVRLGRHLRRGAQGRRQRRPVHRLGLGVHRRHRRVVARLGPRALQPRQGRRRGQHPRRRGRRRGGEGAACQRRGERGPVAGAARRRGQHLGRGDQADRAGAQDPRGRVHPRRGLAWRTPVRRRPRQYRRFRAALAGMGGRARHQVGRPGALVPGKALRRAGCRRGLHARHRGVDKLCLPGAQHGGRVHEDLGQPHHGHQPHRAGRLRARLQRLGCAAGPAGRGTHHPHRVAGSVPVRGLRRWPRLDDARTRRNDLQRPGRYPRRRPALLQGHGPVLPPGVLPGHHRQRRLPQGRQRHHLRGLPQRDGALPPPRHLERPAQGQVRSTRQRVVLWREQLLWRVLVRRQRLAEGVLGIQLPGPAGDQGAVRPERHLLVQALRRRRGFEFHDGADGDDGRGHADADGVGDDVQAQRRGGLGSDSLGGDLGRRGGPVRALNLVA